MNIQWQDRIQRFGLVNYHFLSRNLAAALVLLPRILPHFPFVKISQHGMSLLVTTPALAYTVLPAERSRLRVPLWVTVLITSLPTLLYNNSGYIQPGYRFSLDYMTFLMMLLAVGNRPISRLWKALVVISDGNDTSSRHTLEDARQRIRESETLVYAIGVDCDESTPGRSPLLQRRGLFRTAYEGKTLREHYGLAWPTSAFQEAALQGA